MNATIGKIKKANKPVRNKPSIANVKDDKKT
jgi:hypothetical protein